MSNNTLIITVMMIVIIIASDTLLLLQMLYSSFFFFLFRFTLFHLFLTRFFSRQTSVIDLKLQQKVENGLSSHRNTFIGYLTDGYKITRLD